MTREQPLMPLIEDRVPYWSPEPVTCTSITAQPSMSDLAIVLGDIGRSSSATSWIPPDLGPAERGERASRRTRIYSTSGLLAALQEKARRIWRVWRRLRVQA